MFDLAPPHGPSVPQVEELSQLEVDMEEKMGRADQSLAQVKGVSCRIGGRIRPLFPLFPPPAVPRGVPSITLHR